LLIIKHSICHGLSDTIFKKNQKRLLKCELISLGHIVVDLRKRQLRRKEKNYVGSEALPTSKKEKESLRA